jgi:hypothetical protein
MEYPDDDARPVQLTRGGTQQYELSHRTGWPIEWQVDEIQNEEYDVEGGKRTYWGVHDGDVGEGRVMYIAAGVSGRGPYRIDGTYPERLRVPIDLSSIDEEACDLLYGLVRAIRPRRVLETGTHKGRSALAITTALTHNNQGFLWTVDAFEFVKLKESLPPVCQTRVTQIVGSTPEVFLQFPLAEIEGIDFAFLDGAHDGDTLLKEIEFVDAHRAKTCYVCVDNSLDSGWPEVREVLNAYQKYPLHIALETMAGMDIICMRDDAVATLEGATSQAVHSKKKREQELEDAR